MESIAISRDGDDLCDDETEVPAASARAFAQRGTAAKRVGGGAACEPLQRLQEDFALHQAPEPSRTQQEEVVFLQSQREQVGIHLLALAQAAVQPGPGRHRAEGLGRAFQGAVFRRCVVLVPSVRRSRRCRFFRGGRTSHVIVGDLHQPLTFPEEVGPAVAHVSDVDLASPHQQRGERCPCLVLFPLGEALEEGCVGVLDALDDARSDRRRLLICGVGQEREKRVCDPRDGKLTRRDLPRVIAEGESIGQEQQAQRQQAESALVSPGQREDAEGREEGVLPLLFSRLVPGPGLAAGAHRQPHPASAYG